MTGLQLRPTSSAKKNVWMIIGNLLLIISIAVIGNYKLHSLQQRLVALEQSYQTMSSSQDLSLLRDSIDSSAQQLNVLERWQSQLSEQLSALRDGGEANVRLQQQISQQQTKLHQLQQTVTDLQQRELVQPVPQPTAVITPISTPTKTHSPAKPKSTTFHKPPFILSAIEYRGTRSFAVVSPRNIHQLSQVQLLSEGQSIAGWVLVRISHRQAIFRVDGRLQTLTLP